MQVLAQVSLRISIKLIVQLVVLNPRLIQHLFDCGSAVLVLIKSHSDEIHSVIRYVTKHTVVRLVMNDEVVDCLLRRAVVALWEEGGSSSQ